MCPAFASATHLGIEGLVGGKFCDAGGNHPYDLGTIRRRYPANWFSVMIGNCRAYGHTISEGSCGHIVYRGGRVVCDGEGFLGGPATQTRTRPCTGQYWGQSNRSARAIQSERIACPDYQQSILGRSKTKCYASCPHRLTMHDAYIIGDTSLIGE